MHLNPLCLNESFAPSCCQVVGNQEDRLRSLLSRRSDGFPDGRFAASFPRELLGIHRRCLLPAETGTVVLRPLVSLGLVNILGFLFVLPLHLP